MHICALIFQHYPEFCGHAFEVIDARHVKPQNSEHKKVCEKGIRIKANGFPDQTIAKNMPGAIDVVETLLPCSCPRARHCAGSCYCVLVVIGLAMVLALVPMWKSAGTSIWCGSFRRSSGLSKCMCISRSWSRATPL